MFCDCTLAAVQPTLGGRRRADGMLHLHVHLQDTGGFFIAVLEKVAPTPPLEEPKMGHRCVTRMVLGGSTGQPAIPLCLHPCTWSDACVERMLASASVRRARVSVLTHVLLLLLPVACRFATYVQSSSQREGPSRIVRLDGQEPLQGAADAAEAAIQVSGHLYEKPSSSEQLEFLLQLAQRLLA